MNLIATAGLGSGIMAILIGLAVYRLRQRPLSLERFRPRLEDTLNNRVAPLQATVGGLAATRLRWSGIEITARDIRLLGEDGHLWVSFAQVVLLTPLSAVLSPRGLETFTGPWLFSGAMVDALSPQPPFEALHGIATATDESLRFDIAGGRWAEVAVTQGTIMFEGLVEDQTQADISFHCNATAAAALQAVTAAPLDVVDPSLFPKTGIEGTVEADINLKFSFDELPRMDHSTKAEVRDLRMPNVIGGLDLSEGLFDITVVNDTATVEGKAHLGGVPTTLGYSKPAGSQPETLQINTTDVGALAALMDISGRLAGGRLGMRLARHGDEEPWSGSVGIQHIRVLQAPLLSRLLTMASLTGLVSTLISDGLKVEDAHAELTIEPERLRCPSVRISVDQLEITGQVDFHLKTDRIQGEGLLIPAAALQRLVGAVPVLGAFLEGFGKKNAPIVATRFTISGPLSYPEITVHPLSSIAPDILRDLGIV